MADSLSKAEHNNRQGNTLFQINQYKNATQFYSQAIQLQPQVAKYYGNRAACYIMLSDYIKGLQDAKKSVELDAGFLKGYMRIVKCCMASGDLQYAEKTLLTARGIFPESTDIRTTLEIIHRVQQNESVFKSKMEQRKYREAVEFVEKCIADSAQCFIYKLKRAECLVHLEQFDEAEQIVADVLKVKPTNDDALYVKALSKYCRGDGEQTYTHLVDLKRQLPDHPKTSKLYRNASKIKTTNRDIDAAIAEKNYLRAYELISAAIKLDDTNKYVNRRLYQRKIDIAGKETALLWNGTRDCTKFIDMYGYDLKIAAKRAEYYMDMEEFEDAVTDYEEIVTKDGTKENKDRLKKARQMFEAQMKSDYRILKVPEKCSEDEVKKSYKNLVKLYHPDKNGDITAERKKVLENKLIRIRDAQKRILAKK